MCDLDRYQSVMSQVREGAHKIMALGFKPTHIVISIPVENLMNRMLQTWGTELPVRATTTHIAGIPVVVVLETHDIVAVLTDGTRA